MNNLSSNHCVWFRINPHFFRINSHFSYSNTYFLRLLIFFQIDLRVRIHFVALIKARIVSRGFSCCDHSASSSEANSPSVAPLIVGVENVRTSEEKGEKERYDRGDVMSVTIFFTHIREEILFLPRRPQCAPLYARTRNYIRVTVSSGRRKGRQRENIPSYSCFLRR